MSAHDSRPVRTILRMLVRAGHESAFEAAWRTAAAEISRAPGQLRQELMRDGADPRWYAIVSDWTDRASVDAFGRSSARETLTAALRDLREDADRSTFEVLATVEGSGAGGGPGEAAGRVRSDVSTSVPPEEQDAFERAYLQVAGNVGSVVGQVREELLREEDGRRYHILTEWASQADLDAWSADPSHREDSAALAPWFSQDFHRRVFSLRQRPAQTVPTDWDQGWRGAVRSDVSTSVAPEEQEAFERAYLQVAGNVGSVAGQVREELLREEDGRKYHILTEWASQADLDAWSADPSHREDSAALAPWLGQDFHRRVFQLRQRPAESRQPAPPVPARV